MKQISNKFIGMAAYLLCCFFSVLVYAAQGNVLSISDIDAADEVSLLNDAKLFKSIGMGIALSIAVCEEQDSCLPTVEEDEITQLINTLDERIEKVLTRQQDSQEELDEIILAYVESKENYTDYLNKLSNIAKPDVVSTDDLSDDLFSTEDEALSEDEYSAFEDFDDDLEDDDLDFEDEAGTETEVQ